MIRCIIVDDEPLAINLLKNYAARIPELEIVQATTDVFAALTSAQNLQADLVFLDIQMPELTGIQFMKILNGRVKVVLTTAYEEYALQAFDHDVVDYLLKPFSFDRFSVAVNKAKDRITQPKINSENSSRDHIFVKSDYRMLRIDLSDILYLESLRDYVAIHSSSGKILTLQSLRSFEESLPASHFIRVHKSYIIALSKIKSIERKRIVIGQEYIPIGDTYMDEVKKRLPIT